MQNRLTIVINKKDSATNSSADENYTSEQVLTIVRKHLCESVFECTDKDLPKDSVILVSGLSALEARQTKHTGNPNPKECRKCLRRLTDSTEYKSEEDIVVGKNNISEWMKKLENFSNIEELEKR